MKNNLLFFLGLVLFLSSCTEIMPTIPELEKGDRKVIIEEFTGVRCVGCPAGSDEIENLLALYPDNLIAISIHNTNNFSEPWSGSQYDFRTPKGDELTAYLGPPFSYPSAIINRRLFPGKTRLQVGKAEWGGLIAEEISQSPKLALTLDKAYDSDSRVLNMTATIIPNESIDEDVAITIMMTESNIVDYQITPQSSSPDPDYIHKHVLREMLSQFDGDQISEVLVENQPLELNYSFTLPNEWVAANCNVVAFVHYANNPDNKVILQAIEAHVED